MSQSQRQKDDYEYSEADSSEDSEDAIREQITIPGFEEYCQDPIDQYGRVINHRNLNGCMQYLFVDNSQPPNYVWIHFSQENLCPEQKQKISDYWDMLENIDGNGIPVRSGKDARILNVIRHEDDIFYLMETLECGMELTTASQTAYSFKINPILEYYEKQLLEQNPHC
ncbi:hypothetical protein TRFO_02529 [Tritrichomonas foetus]|uniref:Uncharacterized protein n=1 Tax=Tritrichomonas foetus TaxID=1144522 RepID=A0A1J4L659_9EUKA|nr:hypothetical protein TRFO_02529 [Tritrichomonas foetus]|eukprot:OHT17500.1 hypothetical protein TRFO_02529 [Tritrichomonas foetus]